MEGSQRGSEPGSERGGNRPVSAVAPMNEFLRFGCNFVVGRSGELCAQALSGEAWVTQCSHLLCPKHAQEWFEGHDDCPVCRAGATRLVKMDFRASGRSGKRERMALVGMTPPEIISATETALNFWVDQKAYEHQTKKKRRGALTARQTQIKEAVEVRLKEADTACSGLEAEQKTLQAKLEATDQENAKANEELRALKREVVEAQEQYNSLASRLADGQRHDFFRQPLHSKASRPLTAPERSVTPTCMRRRSQQDMRGHGEASGTPNTTADALAAPPHEEAFSVRRTPPLPRKASSGIGNGVHSRVPSPGTALEELCSRFGSEGSSVGNDGSDGGRAGLRGGSCTPGSARRQGGSNSDFHDFGTSGSLYPNSRKLPTFTPGFVGHGGRLKQRRIT